MKYNEKFVQEKKKLNFNIRIYLMYVSCLFYFNSKHPAYSIYM